MAVIKKECTNAICICETTHAINNSYFYPLSENTDQTPMNLSKKLNPKTFVYRTIILFQSSTNHRTAPGLGKMLSTLIDMI